MYAQVVMNVNNTRKIAKDELDIILDRHKAWLQEEDNGERAVLRGVDFAEYDFAGFDLSYADLSGSDFSYANLCGANLSCAKMDYVCLRNANLTNAILEKTYLFNANLMNATFAECNAKEAYLCMAVMWGCNFQKAILNGAVFFYADACDCDFTGAKLTGADFYGVDFDNAVFVNADLKKVRFNNTGRLYWSDFTGADVTGASFTDCNFNERNLKKAKGLYVPMYCPEEGSFVAWKKCRDDRIVKLLVPENADRKGNGLYSCRASEALVLEVYDKDGNPAMEAVSIIDEDFKYIKGEKVVPKKREDQYYGDISGIYFMLSREEAARYK